VYTQLLELFFRSSATSAIASIITVFDDELFISSLFSSLIWCVVGYIWVQDKIYCVQHARELTRPPGGGYTAYVIDAPDA